jgi:Ca-activated chloride channel family protein
VTFLRPEWFAALPLLLVAAWFLLRQRLDASPWRGLVDPELATVVLTGRHGRAAGVPWGRWLVIAGWLLALIALAGPAFRQQPQPVTQNTDPVVIVLDLSLSMYSRDVAPSRLDVARFRIRDLLAERRGGLTGLVAFAGDAHVVVPLTDDPATIENLLPSLEPAIMPILGSRPEDGVALAQELLDGAGFPEGALLLFTDEVPDPESVLVASRGNALSVVGVGTAEGAPVPLEFSRDSGYLRDARNRVVIPRLDPEALRRLAGAAGGRYGDAVELDGPGVSALLARRDRDAGDEREDEDLLRWYDDGVWLLPLLLPLALLAFRRGAVLVVLLTAGAALPAPAQAGMWSDLWLRRDQQALQALREGDPEQARSLFEDPRWAAVAAHRAGDHEGAATGFADARTAEELYNLGTVLAHAERFEDAVRALEAAVDLDPEHEDARHNLQVLKDLLDEQQQAQDSQGDQGRDDPGRNAGERQDPEAGDAGDAGASQQEPSDGQAGEGEDGEPREPQEAGEPAEPDAGAGNESPETAELSEEELQASEKWLQRIPDEPGALLREKFRYETRNRLRRSRVRPPEPERIW